MINIIDNFYEGIEFNLIFTYAGTAPYRSTYQPNETYYPDRLKAYPCYETKALTPEDNVFNVFCSTLEKKSNLKIKTVNTFFRKILRSELDHIFKYKLSPHRDNKEYDIAGLIYLNTWNLKDGTNIYSMRDQIEPDVLVGSKPNRCVFYKSDVWHGPSHDKKTEMRLIQPFFIKL